MSQSKIPTFVVDLESPPHRRWDKVVEAYHSAFPLLIEFFRGSLVDSMDAKQTECAFADLVSLFTDRLRRLGCVEYLEELRGMSEACARHGSDVSFEWLAFVHLCYESRQLCTSIMCLEPNLASDEKDSEMKGVPWLARTLDWNMGSLLKSLVIHVTFVRGEEIVCEATTFAGYIGIMTGMRPHSYGIAVNYRLPIFTEVASLPPVSAPPPQTQKPAKKSRKSRSTSASKPASAINDACVFSLLALNHILRCKLDQPDLDAQLWPIGFVVRFALEQYSTYESSVQFLSSVPLLAPTYFIMVGTQPAQTVILTRSETQEAPRQSIQGSQSIGVSNPPAAAAPPVKSSRKKLANSSPPASGIGFLVQANLDLCLSAKEAKKWDVTASLPRCAVVAQMMAQWSSGEEQIELVELEEELWRLLFHEQIWDEQSLHATIMCPARSIYKNAVEPGS